MVTSDPGVPDLPVGDVLVEGGRISAGGPDPDDIDTMPLDDAVGTLVLGADARDVDTVLVAGRTRRAGGHLVGIDRDRVRADVTASRDAILARIADQGPPPPDHLVAPRAAGLTPSPAVPAPGCGPQAPRRARR